MSFLPAHCWIRVFGETPGLTRLGVVDSLRALGRHRRRYYESNTLDDRPTRTRLAS